MAQCRQMRVMDEIGPNVRQRKQFPEQLQMPVHRVWSPDTVSQPSQAVTRLQASRVGGGFANPRGFVTTRRSPADWAMAVQCGASRLTAD